MRDGRKFWLFCPYHEVELWLWIDNSNTCFLRETFRDAQVVLSTVSTVSNSFILANPYVAPVLSCAIQSLTLRACRSRTCDLVAIMSILSFSALVCDDSNTAEEKLHFLSLACGFFARTCSHKSTHFHDSARLLHSGQEILDYLKQQ
jgi:hypothetical protein